MYCNIIMLAGGLAKATKNSIFLLQFQCNSVVGDIFSAKSCRYCMLQARQAFCRYAGTALWL